MTAEQKKAYHTEASRVSRGKRDATEHSEASTSQTPPKKRPVGRPPRNESAMSPNTLKERKIQLSAHKRHSMKVSKARQQASYVRWQISEENVNASGPKGCRSCISKL